MSRESDMEDFDHDQEQIATCSGCSSDLLEEADDGEHFRCRNCSLVQKHPVYCD